jgi:glucokinase
LARRIGTGSWLLGIEIGGTKLQLGIGRGDGSLAGLKRLRVNPANGAAGIRDQIRTAFPVLLTELGLDRSQIEAAGIGFGGPVDSSRGTIQRSYQIDGWEGYPLASWISDELGVGVVVIENDADTAGLAEARLGAGAGYSPLLYLTVGSGIGGALIIDGQIYRGTGVGAVEIGHLKVPVTTEPESRTVELEQVASGWAIASAAQQVALRSIESGARDWPLLALSDGNPGQITAAMVSQAAIEGDATAAAIIERAQQAIAFALVQAITLLAPRRIVMGGGLSLIGENTWFEPLRRLIDRDVFGPFKGRCDLVAAALGEQVVVHGAVALAIDRSQIRHPTA